ncbi:signal recognition particle-docking protein FtsY [bacterium]|nr:signal recognition particle-docking protein FtsY [bacterium]
MNLFKKIIGGFGKTRGEVRENLKQVLADGVLDDDKIDEMEEVLISADLGVQTTMELTDRLRDMTQHRDLLGDEVITTMARELEKMLSDLDAGGDPEITERPWVTFVVGVNGSGKTTTIGKLANMFARRGEKVLIVAADTFRQAAVEQIAIWADRAGVEIVRGKTGSDPGAVVYDGLSSAVSRKVDRVLVDTAGRLHTKVNLMKELEKLDRVAKKIIPNAPHEVLLVIDGTTGQNGLSQAKAFVQASGVNALAVTKLDGTAKGGVIVPIGRELHLPVRWIGLGEGLDDLVPFHPQMVVRAVFGEYDLERLEKDVEEMKALPNFADFGGGDIS